MNAWKPVLQMARRSLIALAVVVVLSIATVYGLGVLAANLQQTLNAQQGSLQAEQANLEAHQNDLSNMRTHIKAYETLRQQGLVGTAERAQWVEQLQTSFREQGLPGSLGVQLQAAKTLADNGSGEPPSDPNAPPIVPQSHDLQFEIRDVHEGELLTLLQDFREHARARFRIDSCHLRDPSDKGLTAICVLRFITIPATMAAAAPQTPASGAP